MRIKDVYAKHILAGALLAFGCFASAGGNATDFRSSEFSSPVSRSTAPAEKPSHSKQKRAKDRPAAKIARVTRGINPLFVLFVSAELGKRTQDPDSPDR